MARQITFMAYWQVYSDITVDLPDDIDENDKDAINAFVQEKWDEMDLPGNSHYVCDSDEVDFEKGFEITEKEE